MNLAFVGHELQLGFVVYLWATRHAGGLAALSSGLQMALAQTLAYRAGAWVGRPAESGSAGSSPGVARRTGPPDRGPFVAVCSG